MYCRCTVQRSSMALSSMQHCSLSSLPVEFFDSSSSQCFSAIEGFAQPPLTCTRPAAGCLVLQDLLHFGVCAFCLHLCLPLASAQVWHVILHKHIIPATPGLPPVEPSLCTAGSAQILPVCFLPATRHLHALRAQGQAAC